MKINPKVIDNFGNNVLFLVLSQGYEAIKCYARRRTNLHNIILFQIYLLKCELISKILFLLLILILFRSYSGCWSCQHKRSLRYEVFLRLPCLFVCHEEDGRRHLIVSLKETNMLLWRDEDLNMLSLYGSLEVTFSHKWSQSGEANVSNRLCLSATVYWLKVTD